VDSRLAFLYSPEGRMGAALEQWAVWPIASEQAPPFPPSSPKHRNSGWKQNFSPQCGGGCRPGQRSAAYLNHAALTLAACVLPVNPAPRSSSSSSISNCYSQAGREQKNKSVLMAFETEGFTIMQHPHTNL
jgi:hypothetical protein